MVLHSSVQRLPAPQCEASFLSLTFLTHHGQFACLAETAEHASLLVGERLFYFYYNTREKLKLKADEYHDLSIQSTMRKHFILYNQRSCCTCLQGEQGKERHFKQMQRGQLAHITALFDLTFDIHAQVGHSVLHGCFIPLQGLERPGCKSTVMGWLSWVAIIVAWFVDTYSVHP